MQLASHQWLKIVDFADYNAEIPSIQWETQAINTKTHSLEQVTVNPTGALKRWLRGQEYLLFQRILVDSQDPFFGLQSSLTPTSYQMLNFLSTGS